MNREAIFSDGTERYISPKEPKPGDRVIIRLRTHREDKLSVFLCTGSSRASMTVDILDGCFSYYRANINIGDSPFSYWFEIHEGDDIYYFDRYGISEHIRGQYSFSIMPGFSVPDWCKGAVMYQILVDRFAKGDLSTDVETGEYYYISTPVKKIDNWDEMPKDFDVANFYGGDLAGVSEKLHYLKSLGVEVIYFNPIFVSPSNHKYDAQDYDHIDPHYARIVEDGGECLKEGDSDNSHATKYIKRVTDKRNLDASNEFFAKFVEEAHKKGIRVIIDGVFNHCGSFNKWLDREGIYRAGDGYAPGAYWDKSSPYVSFFSFDKEGQWPENKHYRGWWDHDTLPKLNYEESETLLNYILEIGKKWVSPPYNVDGWRLDVAADLGHSPEYNHKFWKLFRKVVKEANPEAVILAEHYGDASSWLRGDEWDTIMNYDAFMDPISFFLTGMEKHSDGFFEDAIGDGERFELTMRHAMTEFTESSLLSAMNQLSNHDHSRFMTRTNHKVGRVKDLGSQAASEDIDEAVFRQGVLMQMTWPGAPTLYYGDEAGVCGFTDPDNRRTYPWDNVNYKLLDFYRDCIYMHKLSRALRLGSFIFLATGKDFVSYGRFTTEEKVIIAINTSEESREVSIPVWKAEVPLSCTLSRHFVTNSKGYSILPRDFSVEGGYLNVTLDPKSGSVYRI